MPAQKRSLAITDRYRRDLAALVRPVERTVRAAWRGLDWADLDRSYLPIHSTAYLSITRAQRDAVNLTAGYLAAYLSSEMGTGQSTPRIPAARYVGRSFTDADLNDALRSPLIRVKVANKERQPDPMGTGLKAMVAAVDLDVKGAARRSLRDFMEADDRIVGWRRALSGTCAACAGLAEGAASPAGTPLEVHPSCECVSEGAVNGMRYDAPRNATAEQVIRELGLRFPMIEGRFRMLTELRKHQLGGASFDGVHVSDQFFDDAFMAKWANEFNGLQIGNLDSIEGARRSVITHEMGHFLEKSLANVNRAAWEELHALVVEDVSYDVGGRTVTVPRWRSGGVGDIGAPSAYASESPYEFIAESFNDYIHNGAGAKPASQRIGKLIEDNLGRG